MSGLSATWVVKREHSQGHAGPPADPSPLPRLNEEATLRRSCLPEELAGLEAPVCLCQGERGGKD